MKSFVSPPFLEIREAFGLLWIDTADDRRGAFSDAVFIDVYPAGGLGLHEWIAGIDDLTEYGDKASGAQSLLHGSLDHGQAGLIGNNQEDALFAEEGAQPAEIRTAAAFGDFRKGLFPEGFITTRSAMRPAISGMSS